MVSGGSNRDDSERIKQLDEFIGQLRDTDPTDSVWEHLDDRLKVLQAILKEKVEARRHLQARTAALQRLQKALEAFAAADAGRLEFHELTWPEQIPNLEALPGEAADLDNIADYVARLAASLQEHEALRTSSSTYREMMENVSRLQAIHNEIVTLYQRLVTALGVASAPHDTPAPANGGEPGSIGSPSGVEPTFNKETAPDAEPTSEETPSNPRQRSEQEDAPGAELVPAEEAASEAQLPPAEEVAPEAESHTTSESQSGEDLEIPFSSETSIDDLLALLGERVKKGDLATLLWGRVKQGDLATAYWLAFAGSEAASGPTVPPWILKACFLAKHVTQPGDAAAVELTRILMDHPHPTAELREMGSGVSTAAAQLLVALASVRPALVAPETGAQSWLQEAESVLPPLKELFRAVLEFSHTGVGFDLTALQGRQEAYQHLRSIEAYRDEAAEWIQLQEKSGLGYVPARKVLRRLTTDDTEVGRAVAAVARNQPEQATFVRRVINKYLASERAIRDLIQAEARAAATPAVPKPTITGPILGAMVTRLTNLREIMVGWAAAAEVAASHQPDWYEKQLSALHARFRAAWQNLQQHDWLASEDQATAAILNALDRTLAALNDALMGQYEQKAPDLWPQRLAAPLLLLDDVPLENEEDLPAAIAPAAALELAERVRAGEDAAATVRRHVEHRDFLAARLALRGREEELGPDFITFVADQEAESRAALHRLLNDVRRDLEQATLEHVLTDAERSDLEAHLLSIEKREEGGYRRHQRLEAQIREVQENLQERRRHRAQHLESFLGDLANAVAGQEGIGRGLEEAQDYHRKAREALERGNLVLADEYATLVDEILRRGPSREKEVDRAWMKSSRHFRQILPQLIKLLEDREPGGLISNLARGKSVPPLDVSEVPGARLRESRMAMAAFSQLKDSAVRGRNKHKQLVTSILQYLGFQEPQLTAQGEGKGFRHYQAEMSDGGVAPLPQFGSQRFRRYDVLVVWGRPNAETIGQIIQDRGLASHAPILLYMGRMPLRQREEWGRYCQRHQLTALLVDEVLMFYLATLRGHRLPTCVACSMPWGFANPYVPFGANVPPEMFKGRDRIIQALTDPQGPAVLYGGRQLGKSAILRIIERRYRDPERPLYIFLEEIRTLGAPDATQPLSDVWRRIREWAVRNGLLDRRTTDDPAEVHERLLEQLQANPSMRILVLLDEADNFLQADAEQDFHEIGRLKRLMDATDRRFKVVFSGLHSVQRFSSIPNHPFAHLGAVNVGPLDPRSAEELIRHPLAALGFEFEPEDDPVYRILAYTNYQPALIQQFCRELIKARQPGPPPYRITLEMVDDIFRNPEVRRSMKERFEWTVELDPRYALLVYAMILEQVEDRDGYRREFRAREVLEAARQWLEEGAHNLAVDEVRSLLDELEGLGVLVRMESGTYRLRNANVVRALGSHEEIVDRMVELGGRLVSTRFDRRKFHAPLDDDGVDWSPLTLEQEAALLKHVTGMGLVFSSEALGLENLTPALQRLLRQGSDGAPVGELLTLPPEVLSLASLHSQLERWLADTAAGRLVVLANADQVFQFAEPPAEVIGEVTRLLRRRRSRSRPLVFLVAFSAKDLFRWCLRPAEEREQDEDRVDFILTSPVWGQEMVARFLNKPGMMSSTPVQQRVMEATGGWPWLLRELRRTLAKNHPGSLENVDPRPEADGLTERLLEPTSSLRKNFLAAVGLEALPHGRQIMRFVAAFEELEPGEITPATLELPEVSEQELAAEVLALVRLGALRLHDDTLSCNPPLQRVFAP